MKNLKEIVDFRHTIKVYDAERKVDEDKFKEIMEFVRWSATSFNFPVVRTVVMEKDSELTKELIEKKAMEHNVTIFPTLPKTVFFIVPKNGQKPTIDNRFVREGIKYAAFQRVKPVAEVTEQDIDNAAEAVMGAWKGMGFDDLGLWATRQAYIKVGTLTTAAASQGVDTTSMEGFIPEAINQIFLDRGLIKEDEQVIVAVGLGYRKDETVFNKSERKSYEDFVTVAK